MANEKLVRIKNRIDTTINWLKNNPILAKGEIGIEEDTGLIKIGDGTNNWNNLVYSSIGKGTKNGGEVFNDYTNNKATSANSHAEGNNTMASAPCAHSEGIATAASGNYSHAECSNTVASGESSHAEGTSTKSIGPCSHAEGSSTRAEGSYSHAEGADTTAKGKSSHAEGESTTAKGNYSHAEGFISKDYSIPTSSSFNANHVEGYNTCISELYELELASENAITISNDSITILLKAANTLLKQSYDYYTSDSNKNNTPNYYYSNYKNFIFLKTERGNYDVCKITSISSDNLTITCKLSESALRQIILNDSQTYTHAYQLILIDSKNNNVSWAHTEGYNTAATSNAAHAEGYQNIAANMAAHVEGMNNIASGKYSHAEGQNCMAIENRTHAEGSETKAIGIISHAEGMLTTANGDYSHAENNRTTSSGNSSHAEGVSTIASGFASHSEGDSTTASGLRSHSEGQSTVASGENSHTEGMQTTASGLNSHAEGYKTSASEVNAHAEGYNTVASGDSAHAEGNSTQSLAQGAHSEGINNKAYTAGQHVQGKHALTTDSDNLAHVVGGGDWGSPTNIHTLDWSGNAWYKGTLKVGGGAYGDGNAKEVSTQDYVDGQIKANNSYLTATLKGYTDEKVSGVYKVKGGLNTLDQLDNPQIGDVWNCSDNFKIRGINELPDNYTGSANTYSMNYIFISLPTGKTFSDFRIYPGASIDITYNNKTITCKVIAISEEQQNEIYSDKSFYIIVDDISLLNITTTGTQVTLSNLQNNALQVKAGDSIVYTKLGWYKLAATVDLSSYQTKLTALNNKANNIKYYGDPDIEPSPASYFTVDSDYPCRITGLTDTGRQQTKLIIPYEIDGNKITEFTQLIESPFNGADKLTEVILPDTITGNISALFRGLSSLKTVRLSNNIDDLGGDSFNGCQSLTKIIYNGDNISIGSASGGQDFSDCKSLKEINLPIVGEIWSASFNSCTSLESIRLSEKVTKISGLAFSGCNSLKSIYIENKDCIIKDNAEIPSTTTIYCEQGSTAETYAKTNGNPIVYTGINKNDEIKELIASQSQYRLLYKTTDGFKISKNMDAKFPQQIKMNISGSMNISFKYVTGDTSTNDNYKINVQIYKNDTLYSTTKLDNDSNSSSSYDDSHAIQSPYIPIEFAENDVITIHFVSNNYNYGTINNVYICASEYNKSLMDISSIT